MESVRGRIVIEPSAAMNSGLRSVINLHYTAQCTSAGYLYK